MKKKIMTIILSVTGFFALSQELKTNIEEVTVFQNGAQVTRRGTINLTTGAHDVKVKNVSPLLRKESIQVKGEGDFTILSVSYQTTLTEEKLNTTLIKELEMRKKDLEYKIEDLSAQMQVMQGEEQMINSLHQITTQQYNTIVEMVVKAKQVIQTQLSDLKTRQIATGRKLQEARDQANLTTQELTSLRMPKTTSTNEILVKVNAKKDTKADFSVIYVVNNARWYPTYDLRVNTVAEPLTIQYKANISQQTGEDWTNVKLKLSTTDPSLSGQKPKLAKWDLRLGQGYQNPQQQNNYQKFTGATQTRISGKVTDEYGESLPFANIMAVGSTVGTSTDMDGNFTMNLPQGVTQLTVSYIGYEKLTVNISGEIMNMVLRENAAELNEVSIVSYADPLISKDAHSMEMIKSSNIVRSPARNVSSAVNTIDGVSIRGSRSKKYSASNSVPVQVTPTQNIVSTEFVIDEKYTIQSDTKFYTVNIQDISAPAMYQYYSAPRLDKDVFLTAQLINWEEYNLLEGQTNIFFEGTYVGTSLMDVRYLTDTLNISLGRDKSIVVDRKKSKEVNKRKAFGSDMVAYRDWDINVRNSKQQKINILLEDQFPIAADTRIEVKQEEKSGGKLNEQTGIVTWTLDIDAKQNKLVKLKYSVKYPSSSFVGLD